MTLSRIIGFITRKLATKFRTVFGLFALAIVIWLTSSSMLVSKQFFNVQKMSDDMQQYQQKVYRRIISEEKGLHLGPQTQKVDLVIKRLDSKNDMAKLVFYQDAPAKLFLPLNALSSDKNLKLEFYLDENRPDFKIDTSVQEFSHWKSWNQTFCKNQLNIFGNELALLSKVVIDPKKAQGRPGGEKINTVLNQKETAEFYKFQPGFFTLPCSKIPSTTFRLGNKNHLNTWLSVISNDGYYEKLKKAAHEKMFTLAIQRYEYANLYHTMTDYYNAFLMMKFFKKTPEQTNILFIDGHPSTILDEAWITLFNRLDRAGKITNLTKYDQLIWVPQGYNSFLNQHKLNKVPLIDEYRKFFLGQHGITNIDRKLNCSSIQLLFIWRRDYLAHPRNPSGKVSRKIKNEDELIEAVTKTYKNIKVKAIQLDKYNMKSQLNMINDADLLVAMHGAGLSHSLFLPSHAGLIEFYPTYWSSSNYHFKAMARWHNIKYDRWVNRDRKNESPNYYTRIPPGVLHSLLKKVVSSMGCTI